MDEEEIKRIAKALGAHVTKTGRILTSADLEALADEAEKGYDVEHLRDKPKRERPRSD